MAQNKVENVKTELTELRDSFSKSFINDDGVMESVAYAEEVHRQSDDGTWTEVDTSLELSNGRYVSRGTDTIASFVASSNADDSLISLFHKGHTLSWSIEPVGAVLTQSRAATLRSSDTSSVYSLGKAVSVLEYEELAPGLSVRYAIYNNKVEEDIFFTAKSNTVCGTFFSE